MHVLMVPSWYPRADAPLYGIFFQEQAEAIARRGVRVGVVYPEARSLRGLSAKALLRYHFQVSAGQEGSLYTIRRHGWNVLSRLPQAMRLRAHLAVRLVRRYVASYGRPDLLHAHSARWAALACAHLAHEFDLPYLVTEHFSGFQPGQTPVWMKRLAREGFRQAAEVVCVSTALQRWLVAQQLVEADKTSVIPNFVDEGFFSLPPQPRPAGPFTFFALGALSPPKGYAALIQAFDEAFAGNQGLRLEIGGAGPEGPRLQRLIHERRLGDRVQLLGALTRAEVRAALWRAHAFVHPSRCETFGIALIEAMATGLPVLAVASGGPEDIITEQTGLLVPGGAVTALAHGLRTLAAFSREVRPTEIRRYTVDHFGTAAVAHRVGDAYVRILAQHTRQRRAGEERRAGSASKVS